MDIVTPVESRQGLYTEDGGGGGDDDGKDKDDDDHGKLTCAQQSCKGIDGCPENKHREHLV